MYEHYTLRHGSFLRCIKWGEPANPLHRRRKLCLFRGVTVPLVWKDILVGALFSFLTSIQEASATIFLTRGGWEMIPFGIFTSILQARRARLLPSG